MKFFTYFNENLDHFLDKNSDLGIAVNKIEKFCKRYGILSYQFFDDYSDQNKSKRRLILSTFSRLILALYLLKFLLPAMVDNPWVRLLTSDSAYIIGNSRLISITMTICSSTVLSLALHIQYEELNHRFDVLIFLKEIRNKSFCLKLSDKNQRRVGLKVNFLTEYTLKFMFHSLVIFVSTMFVTTLVIAYMDPNTDYLLISTIFWSVVTIFWALFFYSITVFELIVWYLTTLFLKYKFNEIDESFENCLKFHNNYQLLKVIEHHNRVSVFTSKMNKYFSKLIFVVYYIGTPALQLICYCSHEKSTKFYYRFVFNFVFLVIFSMVFVMNLMSADVIHSAHKSYPLMYKIMLKTKLNFRQKLRLQAFIQRLSDCEIGFHCLDMFPMNINEFSKYVLIASMNYLLIMNNL